MPSNIARGADRRPQPRRPPGSRQGGRYAPNAVADRPSPAPGDGLSLAARPAAPGEFLWSLAEEPHPGLPIKEGPDKLLIRSIPTTNVFPKRRQATISRPDRPNAQWENHTPFGQPFVRSMRERWDDSELGIEMPAQVAVDMLNSGDADPADDSSMEAVRVGVACACETWGAVISPHWPGRYIANGVRAIREDGYKWALTAAAAAARADRYLMDYRDGHRVYAEPADASGRKAPMHSWQRLFGVDGWWHFGVFHHNVWQGADGRLLERMAAHCDTDGEDTMFRPHQNRLQPHESRHHHSLDLSSHLALGVLALDPPPCRRVYADACAHLKKHPITPSRAFSGWWRGRPGALDKDAQDRALAMALGYGLPSSHPLRDFYMDN